jgi:hypothetical protein
MTNVSMVEKYLTTRVISMASVVGLKPVVGIGLKPVEAGIASALPKKCRTKLSIK